MKVKKIGMVLLKVLIILFLVVSFNLLMMPKYITENQDGRIVAEMYREELSPDVLFLGSSTVYSGVSPVFLYENYGITSYVAASSSQTAWDSECLLKEAIKRFDLKLLVLDIGFFTTEDDYAEEVSNRKLFDYMRPSLNKYEGVKSAMAEGTESGWSYVFPVLRYHTRYNDLSLDDLKYMYYKPDVTYNGYIMSTLMSSELPEERSLDEATDVIMSGKNLSCLSHIIDICRENNISLMFMKTPSYQAKWGNGYEAQINEIALANGLAYVNFDNFSSDMGINYYTDSPDSGGHLNLFGAEKFSAYLGGVLKTSFDLPDRREDNDFAGVWDEKINRYESDKAAKVQEMYQ